MEILIVLLVFVLPVLSVILDDRKKKNMPKVKSKRIVWPDDKPVQPTREKMRPAPGAGDSVRPVKPASTAVPAPAAAPDPIRRPDTYASAAGAGLTDSGARRTDAKAASAGHMYSARSTKSRSPEEEQRQPEEKKTFSEKQKLIIYSEILKPKFDS